MFKPFPGMFLSHELSGKHVLDLDTHLRRFLKKNPNFEGTVPTAWHFRIVRQVGSKRDVFIRWIDGGLQIEMDNEVVRHLHDTRLRQLFTVLIWMMRAGREAEHISFNLSDGEDASVARFAFSAFDPQVITLPDQYFFEARGFEHAKNVAKQAPAWRERSDDLVWRGAALGTGVSNPSPHLSTHPSIIQRLRLAHLAKGTELDFAFVPNGMTHDIWQPMLRAGLTGSLIPEETWAGRKYAIDVDGFTNTWSNLMTRLAFGCCVFKVDSQFGYRQWYYDKLHAWKHYIPVKADLSDLFDQIAWAKANPVDCEEIAAQGQALANSMTFESESKVAADLVRAHWDGLDFDDDA